MADIGGRLSDNVFTDMGFEQLDTLAANALKRGRNGEPYGLNVRLPSTGEVYYLSSEQAEAIRVSVTDNTDPSEAVRDVALVVRSAIRSNIPLRELT